MECGIAVPGTYKEDPTISVVIPAYNAGATIGATLECVFQQTVQPSEVLVMDDGSTDNTAVIASSFGKDITVIRQVNQGLSSARNGLISIASSKLIAFLDSDDLWHPRYLETQLRAASLHPSAVAYFATHVTFYDGERVNWADVPNDIGHAIELIQQVRFMERYASSPGPFFPSFCCVPKQILSRLGKEPFRMRLAEDVYFCNRLAFEGPVALCSIPMGAYRLRKGSLSSNRVALNEAEVRAFELLDDLRRSVSKEMTQAFGTAFAIKRRVFAKTLMGIGNKSEARRQLLRALRESVRPSSLIKSVGLLCAIHVPKRLQPKWPSACRVTGRGRGLHDSNNSRITKRRYPE